MNPRTSTACLLRAALLLFATSLLALPGPASAQFHATDLAAAVNKSGRQRMLTQRIVKLYCQIGMDVAAQEARHALRESVALFSRQLEELGPFARTPAQKRILDRMRQGWPALQSLALMPPNRVDAARLRTQAEELLAATHELTSLLESASSHGWLVNLAGRQRMVSQRLAMLYMLRAWDVPIPDQAAQADTAQEEFSAALSRLMRASENSAEIDRELYAIAVQWEWFRSALSLEGVASYTLVVADASESMLRSLERVVNLYVALGR